MNDMTDKGLISKIGTNQYQKKKLGVPIVAQWLMNLIGTMRLWVRSLTLLSGLTVQRCRELWFSLQMWLGS